MDNTNNEQQAPKIPQKLLDLVKCKVSFEVTETGACISEMRGTREAIKAALTNLITRLAETEGKTAEATAVEILEGIRFKQLFPEDVMREVVNKIIKDIAKEEVQDGKRK